MRQLNSQWRLLQPLQSFPTDTTAFLWQSLHFRFILNAMISNVFNVLYPLNKTFQTTGNFSQGDKLSAGPVNNAALLPWPTWSDIFSSVFDLKLAKESSNLSFFLFENYQNNLFNIENEATTISSSPFLKFDPNYKIDWFSFCSILQTRVNAIFSLISSLLMIRNTSWLKRLPLEKRCFL